MNNQSVKTKQNLLNSLNLKHAKRFKNDLNARIQDKHKKHGIYIDFLDMLIAAQKQEQSFEELIPDYNGFLASCTEGGRKNAAVVAAIKHKKPIMIVCAAVLLVVITVLSILGGLHWSGYFTVRAEREAIRTQGISYIIGSQSFRHISTVLDGEFEITLRIDDGRPSLLYPKNGVIFDNGINKIYVESVDLGISTVIIAAGGENGGEELPNIMHITWHMSLITTGFIGGNYNFAQIITGVDSLTIHEPYRHRAKFSYELGGINFTQEVFHPHFAIDGASASLPLIIFSSNILDPAGSAEKLQLMLNAQQVTLRLSGLVLNQWVRI